MKTPVPIKSKMFNPFGDQIDMKRVDEFMIAAKSACIE